MKKKFLNFKGTMLILFLSFTLINLGQLIAQECGPTEDGQEEAQILCDVICLEYNDCKAVVHLYGYCAEGPCEETYRLDCWDGYYDFLEDYLGRWPQCPDP